MKIGILTFHDEVNYGSLLQAYAMQSALGQMGHDVVIIDRWFQPNQARLYGVWHQKSIKAWILCIGGLLTCNGTLSKYIRMCRSRKFIREYLHLTTYHFCDWKDAPEDLGVDLVTVGSDQVWHPNAQPDVYLLNYLTEIPGIAYAASFGATQIPDCKKKLYSNGFKNFKAIGCREIEGVKIVESLGGVAKHVVDPTLLSDPKAYDRFLVNKKCPRHITCYFLTEDYVDYIVRLGKFAKENKIQVEFFAQDFVVRSIPSILKCKIAQFLYPIKLRYTAGPKEFINSLSTAECVFTNSFHAMMFSLIYRRNVRIVKSTAPNRKDMAARMQEFAGTVINGPLIMETLGDAMISYRKGERVTYNEKSIADRIKDSKHWLANVIERIVKEKEND